MSATMPGKPFTGGPIGYTQRRPASGLHSGVRRARPLSPWSASARSEPGFAAGTELAGADTSGADVGRCVPVLGTAEAFDGDDVGGDAVGEESSLPPSRAYARPPAATTATAATRSATHSPFPRRLLSVWPIRAASIDPPSPGPRGPPPPRLGDSASGVR